MNVRRRSYAVYSIGIGIVWAVLLTVTLLNAADRHRNIPLVLAGFAIGWLSATIARFVYPPPKKWRTVEHTP
jgi:uncharacterized membrane protein YjjB (DUF3815 family)